MSFSKDHSYAKPSNSKEKGKRKKTGMTSSSVASPLGETWTAGDAVLLLADDKSVARGEVFGSKKYMERMCHQKLLLYQ